ncbi:MAG: hypothetical protein ACYS22_20425 [Planctomycetota bacterium]|jgi:hypothetical protein
MTTNQLLAGVVLFALGVGTGTFAMKMRATDAPETETSATTAGEGTDTAAAVSTPDARGRYPGPAPDLKRPEPPSRRGTSPKGSSADEAKSAEEEGLRARLAELEKELGAARAELASARKELDTVARDQADVGSGLKVDFGAHGEIEAIKNANWEDLGQTTQRMGDIIAKLMVAEEQGVPAGEIQAMQIEIAKENQKLAQLTLAANGQLPTHATGNGEYTHPIILANLMVQRLVALGDPLDEGQIGELIRLGEQYDLEWHLAQERYREETMLLEKILDELTLKKRWCDQADAVLTASQLPHFNNPAIRHRVMIDIHSPALLLAGRAGVTTGKSIEEIRTSTVAKWAAQTGIAQEVILDTSVLNAWEQAVAPILKPVRASDARFYHLDAGLIAGRAHVEAAKVLMTLAPDEEARGKIRQGQFMSVPRIVE